MHVVKNKMMLKRKRELKQMEYIKTKLSGKNDNSFMGFFHVSFFLIILSFIVLRVFFLPFFPSLFVFLVLCVFFLLFFPSLFVFISHILHFSSFYPCFQSFQPFFFHSSLIPISLPFFPSPFPFFSSFPCHYSPFLFR